MIQYNQFITLVMFRYHYSGYYFERTVEQKITLKTIKKQKKQPMILNSRAVLGYFMLGNHQVPTFDTWQKSVSNLNEKNVFDLVAMVILYQHTTLLLNNTISSLILSIYKKNWSLKHGDIKMLKCWTTLAATTYMQMIWRLGQTLCVHFTKFEVKYRE